MKCLLKYQWVKLPRNRLPPGKGAMGAWARSASQSTLGIRSRQKALDIMDKLAGLGTRTCEVHFVGKISETDCSRLSRSLRMRGSPGTRMAPSTSRTATPSST